MPLDPAGDSPPRPPTIQKKSPPLPKVNTDWGGLKAAAAGGGGGGGAEVAVSTVRSPVASSSASSFEVYAPKKLFSGAESVHVEKVHDIATVWCACYSLFRASFFWRRGGFPGLLAAITERGMEGATSKGGGWEERENRGRKGRGGNFPSPQSG